MKMTPRDKAFYEYGKARGIANERLGILNDATIRTNIECGALDRKEYKELYDIDEAIRDAWEKRTACRAWMPVKERKCVNCKYYALKGTDYPCRDCVIADCDIDVHWEPKKEVENDDA